MTAFGKSVRSFILSALAMGLGLAIAAEASARAWKPDATSAAYEYTQIVHNKRSGDVVILIWLAPHSLPVAPQADELLDKYIILGIVDAHQGTAGTAANTIARIDTLSANDASGQPLKSLTVNDLPSELRNILTILQAGLAQNLGAMGQGMRWFVFDNGGVHACSSGGLAIPYQGELYTYDTPIPGCPKI